MKTCAREITKNSKIFDEGAMVENRFQSAAYSQLRAKLQGSR